MSDTRISSPAGEAMLRQQSLIFGAFLAGQVMIWGVCLVLQHQMPPRENALPGALGAVFGLVALGPLALSEGLYRVILRQVPAGAELAAKRVAFARASLMRMALLEGAFFVLVVGFFLTWDGWYLLLALLPLAWFVHRRPNRRAFVRDLRLSPTEQQSV